jgi:hypothetical protein
MLYSAISGKGSFYKDENIKSDMKEKYKKLIKCFCLFGGLIAVAYGAFDFLKIEPIATILFVILCAILLFVIVAIMVLTKPKK